jgi:Arc/MetJ-type ribon-helix-helix transcriptional regulator
MTRSILVALRINPELKAQIDKLVQAGTYRSFSDAVRQILKEFFESEKA